MKGLEVVCTLRKVAVPDVPGSLKTHLLNQSARNAKKDFKTEDAGRVLVAVRYMVKTKVFRPSMDSLLVLTTNSCECQYCAN